MEQIKLIFIDKKRGLDVWLSFTSIAVTCRYDSFLQPSPFKVFPLCDMDLFSSNIMPNKINK